MKLNTHIEKTTNLLELIVICTIILFIPFAYSSTMTYGCIASKFFSFAPLLGFLLLLHIVKSLISLKSISFKCTIIDLFLTLYTITIIGQAIAKDYDITNTIKFLEFVSMVCLYYIMRTTMNERTLRVIIVSLCLSGTAQAIYSILQLYGIYPSNHNLFKVTGGFFNPGPLSGYLAPLLLIALTVYLHRGQLISASRKSHTFLNKIIYEYLPVINIVAILLVLSASKSRAAWVSVLIGCAYLIFTKYNILNIVTIHLNTRIKKIVGILGIVTIATILISGIYFLKKDSANGRLLIWKVTTQMIKQKPIAGHGYNSFQAKYMNYQAEYFSKATNAQEALLADDTKYAYNFLLKTTAEYGIIGLFLVGAIIILAFFKPTQLTNIKNIYQIIAKAGLIGIFAFSIFSYPEEILSIKIILVVCLAIISTYSKEFNFDLKKSASVKYLNQSLNGIRIFLLIAILIHTYPKINILIKKFKHRNDAGWQYDIGHYDGCLSEYEKCYTAFKYDGEYLLTYGKALSMSGKHKKALHILDRTEKYLSNTIVYRTKGDSYKALGQHDKAEYNYVISSDMIPSRFYPKYLLAKLYYETGQHRKAIEMATEILNKRIKTNSYAIKEIHEEMKNILIKSKKQIIY